MVSDGGVHSLDEHLYALLALAEDKGVRRVYVHMFTDGRDTGEKVAMDAVKKLRERIARIGVGEIATVAGRFYAMDRGGHFNQTDMTYRALVNGEGEIATSAEDCIWRNYQNGVYDEMIKPTVICDPTLGGRSQPVAKIEENDAVIFFNFRPDRAVQLTRAFVDPSVLPPAFRHPPIKNLYFATMTEYAQGLPVKVAFPSIDLKNNLAEVISKKNFTQFHISESEKYAHVTSFFDCGKNDPYPGEERKIVASPDNARNYVDHPEMSADELADILASKISGTDMNFFVANFANADMVGHTGSLKAGIKAVEALDRQIKKIMDSCLEAGACLIITADHGNIEQMLNSKTGEIDKDHTTNPVPLLAVAREFKFPVPQETGYGSLAGSVPEGAISDIAPTILDLLGLEKPKEMTGVSLRSIIESRSKN
jgi:2,3-bisphosphoglycerate-independent phosphoglycerate mutase